MNIFWKLVLWLFDERITSIVSHNVAKAIKDAELHCESVANNCIILEYPIGAKVISIPNEPSDLIVGEVVDYEVMHGKVIIWLRNIKTGEKYCMADNRPIHWTPELEYIFGLMDWVERWNVHTRGFSPMDNETRLYKEAYTKGYIPGKRLYNPTS